MYLHALAVLDIVFYNVFHVSKKGRVSSKVTNDEHHQLFGLIKDES